MFEIILDNWLLLWLLNSLIAFLIASTYCRYINNPMERWNSNDWGSVLISCILFPVAWYIILRDIVFPWLIKERHLKNSK